MAALLKNKASKKIDLLLSEGLFFMLTQIKRLSNVKKCNKRESLCSKLYGGI